MKNIQDPEIQQIISSNLNADPQALLLKLSKRKDLPVKEIIEQITGRKKAKDKLPELAQNPAVIFPAGISMEQCSSEVTAKYKSELFSGNGFIDLTCGFGVDARYFSFSFKHLFLVEPNSELIEIVKHNFEVLGIKNANFFNGTAQEFLEGFSQKVDLIYIDPSRRSKDNSKVFLLEDCVPDIINTLPRLFELSNRIMIKTAPMLDIDKALNGLINIEKVIVLSLNNECKEVLYLANKSFTGEPLIETVNLSKAGTKQSFSFFKAKEKSLSVAYSDILGYLYDPNSSVSKAGAFKSVADHFKFNAISGNTHLYTSSEFSDDFPGKKYKVLASFKYDKKEIQKQVSDSKLIIILKNFPDTLEQVKKKLGIKEGGENYLFCFRNKDEKPVLVLASLI